ncbi:MAG: hypothetical protein J6T10_15720 [Methanobrevibacter sp.]|nr:hypothetical protein [Methanobrevibacter sp.]
MSSVFQVILAVDKNTDNDHYYEVKTHEEVINLIRFAQERGQRIKKITEQRFKTLEEIKKGGSN